MRRAPVERVVHDRAASVRTITLDRKYLVLGDLRAGRTVVAAVRILADIVEVELATGPDRHGTAARRAVGTEAVLAGIRAQHDFAACDDKVLGVKTRAIQGEGSGSRLGDGTLTGQGARPRERDVGGRIHGDVPHRDGARDRDRLGLGWDGTAEQGITTGGERHFGRIARQRPGGDGGGPHRLVRGFGGVREDRRDNIGGGNRQNQLARAGKAEREIIAVLKLETSEIALREERAAGERVDCPERAGRAGDRHIDRTRSRRDQFSQPSLKLPVLEVEGERRSVGRRHRVRDRLLVGAVHLQRRGRVGRVGHQVDGDRPQTLDVGDDKLTALHGGGRGEVAPVRFHDERARAGLDQRAAA